jgi:hypothetical protein
LVLRDHKVYKVEVLIRHRVHKVYKGLLVYKVIKVYRAPQFKAYRGLLVSKVCKALQEHKVY